MTENEFYELCQTYRNTPLHEQGQAAQHFGVLWHTVNTLEARVKELEERNGHLRQRYQGLVDACRKNTHRSAEIAEALRELAGEKKEVSKEDCVCGVGGIVTCSKHFKPQAR